MSETAIPPGSLLGDQPPARRPRRPGLLRGRSSAGRWSAARRPGAVRPRPVHGRDVPPSARCPRARHAAGLGDGGPRRRPRRPRSRGPARRRRRAPGERRLQPGRAARRSSSTRWVRSSARWEAGDREGAQVVNEPSAWSMSALQTDDTDARAPLLPRGVRLGEPSPSARPPVAATRLRRWRGGPARPTRRRRRDDAGAGRRAATAGASTSGSTTSSARSTTCAGSAGRCSPDRTTHHRRSVRPW